MAFLPASVDPSRSATKLAAGMEEGNKAKVSFRFLSTDGTRLLVGGIANGVLDVGVIDGEVVEIDVVGSIISSSQLSSWMAV